jgi:putative membrane protein
MKKQSRQPKTGDLLQDSRRRRQEMFMGFGLILTIGLVAAAAYALGWRPQSAGSSFDLGNSGKSALDIAKERYARGEIDKEEFTQIRQDLGS